MFQNLQNLNILDIRGFVFWEKLFIFVGTTGPDPIVPECK